MEVVPIVGMISTFGFLGFLVFMFFTTRHKERMSLIESGKDAGIFNTLPKSASALKWGLVLLMIGIGLAVGLYIDITHDNDGPIATFPSAFISGGIGLLTFYYLIKDKE